MLSYTWQFFVTFLGWLSDPLSGLSDLQLGDKKVTLNHLVIIHWFDVEILTGADFQMGGSTTN